MDVIFVSALVLVALVLLLWKRNPSSDKRKGLEPVFPVGTTVTPASLLTEQEVLLYNLIRLAVQDQYLVFSQVPLWAVVHIAATGEVRAQAFRQIALKRVAFVLVHPGSRQVEQVVQVEDSGMRGRQDDRQRVIESVLDAAGIKLVTLRVQKSYTVPALASLLGCEPDES
ncbi:MAG: hypothetical protein LZF86_240090 [Nitrospira sp.]|nr:MAG: hypothetical protein LZF86_240090 [Nitrospira sp.]